jgi:hypothetical protein
MKYKEKRDKQEIENSPKIDTEKYIEFHKKAATHFLAASKSHFEAAIHHENGNPEKAATSTFEAYGHSSLAKEAQNEVAKHFNS